ncbi:MAG: hypothetical protein JO322_00370 [Candidatus Eremiobacteraeota bacterium]|nr:hypothetical protein [Candidatus Eremiobacteraeota bacterium]
MRKSCRMTVTPRSLTFDYAVALCSVWISSGFFLDAWAHGHVPVESFFTPYHGVFYSGMLAMIVVLAAYWLRHRGLPPGYRLAVLGIPIFIVAGIGDLIWHQLLGIEEGVDALLSPTHQCLGLGIFFLASGPIRSVLADRVNSTSLRTQLPLVLSLVAWLTLFHFGTAYAFDPGAGRTNAPPVQNGAAPDYFTALAIGYYKISIGVLIMIFQAMAMTAFALYTVSRIRLSFGAFTVFYVLGNAAAAAAFTNQTPLLATTLLQSFVAGLIADIIVLRRDPQPDNPAAYRLFAVLVPLAYMGTYLIVTLAFDRLWWDWNEALGAWLWCGVTGFALSLIGTARRTAQ